jgi:hypothetical protein
MTLLAVMAQPCSAQVNAAVAAQVNVCKEKLDDVARFSVQKTPPDTCRVHPRSGVYMFVSHVRLRQREPSPTEQ